MKGKPSPSDIEAVSKGLEKVKTALSSGEYHVVIMEEANLAAKLGLCSVDDILEITAAKPEGIELVITGRSADSRIIEIADLVTEMNEIKH